MAEELLETIGPSRLANMLAADGADRWRPEEMGSILRHQLAAQVESDLGGVAPDDVASNGAAHGACMAREVTFGELLHHPRPSVETLRRVKLFAKTCKAAAEGPLPPEVAAVLYFASIAVAMLRCGTRITELSDEAVLTGTRWALARPWLDQPTRALFEEAAAVLPPTV